MFTSVVSHPIKWNPTPMCVSLKYNEVNFDSVINLAWKYFDTTENPEKRKKKKRWNYLEFTEKLIKLLKVVNYEEERKWALKDANNGPTSFSARLIFAYVHVYELHFICCVACVYIYI